MNKVSGGLHECFQYALADGYIFAEITCMDHRSSEYTLGAHVEKLIEKMCWDSRFEDLLSSKWSYYKEGFMVNENNYDSFISLHQSSNRKRIAFV